MCSQKNSDDIKSLEIRINTHRGVPRREDIEALRKVLEKKKTGDLYEIVHKDRTRVKTRFEEIQLKLAIKIIQAREKLGEEEGIKICCF